MTDKPRLSDPQVRAALARLKKLGLYKGNLRKKQPTEYGRRVLKQYTDVLEGKTHVVTVPRKEAKSFKAAHRVKGSKVVIKKGAVKETARFSKKELEIYRYRQTDEGRKFRIRTIKHRVSNASELPDLKKNQSYRLPFNRWGETAYMYFTDKGELGKTLAEYEGKYKDIYNHIELVEYYKGYDFDEYDDE